jgi:hypothetical protein
LSRLHQHLEQRDQPAAAIGQLVLDSARQPAIVNANDEFVVFHFFQAAHQGAAADGMKFFEEFSRAFGTCKKLADNEERPLIADQLQGAGDWATIDFASSHFGLLTFAPELITIAAHVFYGCRAKGSV